jgi:hypothetical protein
VRHQVEGGQRLGLSGASLDVIGSRVKAAASLLLVLCAAAIARAVEPLETHMTPPGQPPIEAITANDLAPVKALFNRDADRPRVLVMISPT